MGPPFCGAPVRPNILNMPKSASGCSAELGRADLLCGRNLGDYERWRSNVRTPSLADLRDVLCVFDSRTTYDELGCWGGKNASIDVIDYHTSCSELQTTVVGDKLVCRTRHTSMQLWADYCNNVGDKMNVSFWWIASAVPSKNKLHTAANPSLWKY